MSFIKELDSFDCGVISFINDENFSILQTNDFFSGQIDNAKNLNSIMLHSHFEEFKKNLKNIFESKRNKFTYTLYFSKFKKSKWFLGKFSVEEYEEDKNLFKITGICFDITELKKRQHSSNYEKDVLNIALKNADTDVWNYDIKSKTITLISTAVKQKYSIEKIENVPEVFIQNEYIHPDSLFPFLELHDSINRGEPISEAEVRVKTSKGNYKWVRMKYVIIYDSETGSPVDAIGTGEDITNEKEIQLRTLLDTQYREAMVSDALCLVEVNLSKNLILTSDNRLKEVLQSSYSMAFSGLAKAVSEFIIYPEDVPRFYSEISRENLIELFKSDKKKVSFEYRIGKHEDSIYWAKIYVNFILEPLCGDICGLIYVKNITDKKIKEQKLQLKAECDSLSRLYNRYTTEVKVDYQLKNNLDGNLCVFYMIDLDNFKNINDTYGHLSGDELICEISTRIKRIFRESDIISRLGGDEFSVFLSNIPSREFAENKAKQICEVVNSPIVFDNVAKSVCCSIGIALTNKSNTTFKEIYEKADKALYESKSKGKNQYQFYKEE